MRSLLLSLLLLSIVSCEYTIMDVSVHNGVINWAQVKASGLVDGVIIRCGYGDDLTYQDDTQYHYNVKGCIDNGIPFGVYLYSYANTEAQARSEAAHVLRLVNPYKNQLSLPVYYDLEQPGTENVAVSNGLIFLKILQENGYKVGVTGTESWFNVYFGSSFNAYSQWVAKYGPDDGLPHTPPKVTGRVDMWQYSSKCYVNGVSTNVDLSKYYGSLNGSGSSGTNPGTTPENPSSGDDGLHNKTIDQLAREVIAGLWGAGDERRRRLGDLYDAVQQRVNEILG